MDNKYPNLKKAHGGKTLSVDKWTIDNLKDGFRFFYDTKGHYPTADEVDEFEFLPASRTIQRDFGGLVNIRKHLELPTPKDYTKGKTRRLLASELDKKARIYEEEFYNFLISKIPEIRVHEHKIIRPGNVSSDYFIYTNNTDGVVIDLFYSRNLSNVAKIVQIKQFKYAKVPFKTYLIIVGNDTIEQEVVDRLMNNRKTPLPQNVQVLTELIFKERFSQWIIIEKQDL